MKYSPSAPFNAIAGVLKQLATNAAGVLCLALLTVPAYGQAVNIGWINGTSFERDIDVDWAILNEGDDALMYTISITTQPTNDVTITREHRLGDVHNPDEEPLSQLLEFTTSAAGVLPPVRTNIGTSSERLSVSHVFTSSNWATAQTVTIAYPDDGVDHGVERRVRTSHTMTTNDADYTTYRGTFNATTWWNHTTLFTQFQDNDESGIFATSTFNAHENGVGEYTVRIGTAPSSNVIVSVTTPGGITADRSYLTFTPTMDAVGGWNVPQTVTISAADDLDADDDTITIIHRPVNPEDPSYDITNFRNASLRIVNPTVTILDDDVGVVIEHSTREVEEGAVGSYRVHLRGAPDDTVTVAVNVAPSGTTAATVTPANLTFTTDNWARPQPVRITGTADTDLDDETLTITHQATSTDAQYTGTRATYAYQDGNGMDTDASALVVTIDDDDEAPTEITLHALDTNGDPLAEISEASTGDQSVVIKAETKDGIVLAEAVEVVVTVAGTMRDANAEDGDTPVEYEIAAAMQTFTLTIPAGDASAENTITVTMPDPDDTVDEDDETLRITGAAEGFTFTEAAITLVDNDGAPQSISLSVEPKTLSEANAEDTDAEREVAVTASFPTGSGTLDEAVVVTVSIAPDGMTATAEDFGTMADIQVTIAAMADSGTAMLTVNIVDDDIDEDDQHLVLSGSAMVAHVTTTPPPDGAPAGTAATTTTTTLPLTAETTFTLEDDDEAGVTISESNLEIDENQTDTYTVALTSRPTQEVTVAVGDADGAVVATPPQVIFTPGAESDWDEPKTITIRPRVDDNEEDETVTITHTLTSADAKYAAAEAEAIIATVFDAVAPRAAPALPEEPPAVTEGGSATYVVALSMRPNSEVTMTIETPAGATAEPASLTFDNGNWNVERTVTASVAEDDNIVHETLTFTHRLRGLNYEDAPSANLAVEVVDRTLRLAGVRIAEASEPASGDTYGVNETIMLEVEFTRAVVVRGTPQLKLTVGEHEDRRAIYMPPEPTAPADAGALASSEPVAANVSAASAILHFAYQVQEDDEADVIGIPDNPIVLGKGDSILDAEDLTKNADIDVAADDLTVEIAVNLDGARDGTFVANAGEDQEVRERQGLVVTLNGTGSTFSDSSGYIEYLWARKKADETAGDDWRDAITDADKAVATVAIPNLKANMEVTYVLKVTNTRSEQSRMDEVVVSIIASDESPNADAGPDQTAEEATQVILDGTGSFDPEGERLIYEWRLAGGNRLHVTGMNNMNTATPTITLAVNVPHQSQLTFELRVTDPTGNSATDPTTVIITSSPLGEVLGHALSRFGRTLGASAVDTLAERFAPRSANAPGLSMSLGGTHVNLAALGNIVNVPSSTTPNTQGPMLGFGMSGGGMVDQGMPAPHPTMANARGAANGGINPPGIFLADHFDDRLHPHGSPRGGRLPTFDRLLNLDRSALRRGNFEISLGGADESSLNAFPGSGLNAADWAIWGRADHRLFEAEPTGAITLDGTVSIGYVGGDMRFGDDREMVVGLAVSGAESTVDYTLGELPSTRFEGTIDLDMTTFYPYGSWAASDKLTLWGLLGYGNGDAEIRSEKGHHIETDIGLSMVAVGGRYELYTGKTSMAMKGDVFHVSTHADDVLYRNIQDVDADVRRLRVAVELGRLVALPGDNLLRPSIELAARADNGDAETGMGLELALGTVYETAIGLFLDTRVRLALDDEGDFAEANISLMARYDPGTPGGLRATLAPTWGDMTSMADVLWNNEQPMLADLARTSHPDAENPEAARRPYQMNAELEYAVLLPKWTITPYGRFAAGSITGRERLGLRIVPLRLTDGAIELDLFGEQGHQHEGGSLQPGVMARVNLFLR